MKKVTERHKVLGAKMEMELKILEREQDIERLRDNIANQEKRITELDEEIQKLKE
jgi:cell division protein FtsL